MLNRKRTATDATRSSEVESRIPHISTAPPPDSSFVLISVVALATAVTPPPNSALHSSEADAHSASFGLLDGMIQTGSGDGAARITTVPPLGCCQVAATTYENHASGGYELAVGVEN